MSTPPPTPCLCTTTIKSRGQHNFPIPQTSPFSALEVLPDNNFWSLQIYQILFPLMRWKGLWEARRLFYFCSIRISPGCFVTNRDKLFPSEFIPLWSFSLDVKTAIYCLQAYFHSLRVFRTMASIFWLGHMISLFPFGISGLHFLLHIPKILDTRLRNPTCKFLCNIS